MFLCIRMFDIHQIRIKIRKDTLNRLPFHTCHALDGCGNPSLFRSPQKGSCKFRLAETFSSGKSHSSSGAVIIRSVFLHFLDHLSDCHIPSDDLILSKNLHGLDLIFLRFRITAPSAPQNTSFQKHDGTYSRTVMDRIFLDIKHPAFYIQIVHALTFSLSASCIRSPVLYVG